jgi:hypothetical protein
MLPQYRDGIRILKFLRYLKNLLKITVLDSSRPIFDILTAVRIILMKEKFKYMLSIGLEKWVDANLTIRQLGHKRPFGHWPIKL